MDFDLLNKSFIFLDENHINLMIKNNKVDQVKANLTNVAFSLSFAFFKDDEFKRKYEEFLMIIDNYLLLVNGHFSYKELIEIILNSFDYGEDKYKTIGESFLLYPDEFYGIVLNILKIFAYTDNNYLIHRLGYFYTKKKEFRDLNTANMLFEKSFAMGNLDSGFNIGVLSLGLKEYDKAIDYLTRCADRGSTKAQTKLGIFYATTKEYINLDLAIKYSLMASKENSGEAQYNLGYIYQYFKEIEDLNLSIQYYSMSLDNGFIKAAKQLGFIYYNKGDFEKAKSYYSMMANTGDAESQHNLGVIYLKVKEYESIRKAIDYFTLAAEKGYTPSEFNLGYIYSQYNDFKNIPLAIKYYQLAADKGHVSAQFNLAQIYNFNDEFKNLDMAIKYYDLAANQGDVRAMNGVGCIYAFNDKYKDINKSIDYLKRASSQNYADAQNNLGMIYENELKDLDQAKKYYQLGIDNGVVPSLYNMGLMYERNKDYDNAFKYYKQAADKGNIKSCVNLGIIYETNDKYMDIEKAIYYFQKAADCDAEKGFHNLALIYDVKPGYVNKKLAIEYYTKGANKNYIKSIYNLAVIYHTDEEFKNIPLAIEYYKKAVEQNHLNAAFNLALIYIQEKEYLNKQEALKLFENVANQGHEKGIINYLDLLYSDEELTNYDNKYYAYNKALYYLKTFSSPGASIFLGDLFDGENLFESNYSTAYKYYKKALELNPNNPVGLYKLGCYLYYGKSGIRDLNKAREYLEKANDLGSKCDFILQLLYNELGISNDRNYISEYLKSNQGFKTAKSIIDSLFDGVNLDEDIKVYLSTALVIYFNFCELENKEKIHFDFSPCITTLFKAMECVIRKYLIDDYRKYLMDNIVPSSMKTNKYFVYKTEDGEYDYLTNGKFNKFTLGDFRFLIGLKNEYIALKLDETTDDLEVTNIDDTCNIKKVDQPLIDYSKNVLFKKDSFDYSNKDEEINNYFISIYEFIEDFLDEVRNPATHNEVINRSKAETMINYFLFTNKILVNFYKKLN